MLDTTGIPFCEQTYTKISLSIIYATFTLSNFIAAPVVGMLGPKWAMVFGVMCYAVFQIGFLFLNQVYLYITSAILGIGAAS